MFKNLPYQTILALSPHTDDIEFGCGGTLARLIEQGAEIHTAVFSLCEQSVPEGYPDDVLLHEMRASAAVYGIPESQQHVYQYPVRRFSEHRQDILEEMVALRKSIQPDLVFTPATYDIHQDHEVISQESIRAFRFGSMLGYELPWNNLHSAAPCLITISQENLKKKSTALACYKSQGFRHYSQPEIFRAQATMRGLQNRSDLSEAFEVIRLIY